MTKIYLAARYSRREELCGYAEDLKRAGHSVMSRWLEGNHQIADNGMPIGDDGEALVEGFSDSEKAMFLRQQFAMEDLRDIDYSEMLIAFTEPPRSSASRGGRHVEFGYALAQNKPILIVGHKENVFCWLPDPYLVWTAMNWEVAKRLVEVISNHHITKDEAAV